MQPVSLLICGSILVHLVQSHAQVHLGWGHVRDRIPAAGSLLWRFVPSTLRRQEPMRPITLSRPEEVPWLNPQLQFGQISGVDVDKENRPVIFHRGSVVWDGNSFDVNEKYRRTGQGPIGVDTIMTLNPDTGAVVASFGKGIFYMPHGLSLDGEGNVWVTDVALHQVFKFKYGETKPELTLGEAFTPGSDDNHFCKPTYVVVASNGVFYVADGYCNSRIMKFSPNGTLLGQFGESGGLFSGNRADQFNVPHSLVLLEERDTICVADRENQRVSCFSAGVEDDRKFGHPILVSDSKLNGRVFGVAARGSELYAVTGPTYGWGIVRPSGYTLSTRNGQVLDTWNSFDGMKNPHDIAVSPDGKTMYVTEIGPNKLVKFDIK